MDRQIEFVPQATPEDRVIRYSSAPSQDEVEAVKNAILAKLTLAVGSDPAEASDRDWFVAAALAARDRIVLRWTGSEKRKRVNHGKRVYYLSLEFLIGRLLGDVLHNLELHESFTAALGDLGVDVHEMFAAEADAALGNGGLGRLAACFMESMASMSIEACGYGIRYDHGLFRQVIKDGVQEEYPETWLSFGNPWEFERPETVYDIGFGGHVEMAQVRGTRRAVWHPGETVEAVAYDTPAVGWRGRHVNPLRLWSARAPDPLRLDVFNSGDHIGALSEQARAEAISKILYPSDQSAAGHELRLRQEFFFVSASLQDLVHRHVKVFGDVRSLPEKAAIQLNDTHPSVAVAELMRILVDVHALEWDEAWDITVRDAVLHQSHADAGGAGDLAGGAVRAAAAPAHADHLPDQRQAPGARGGARRRRRRIHGLGLAHRRAQRTVGAHGAPGLCRIASGERRLGAAQRTHAQGRSSPICTRFTRSGSSTRPTA